MAKTYQVNRVPDIHTVIAIDIARFHRIGCRTMTKHKADQKDNVANINIIVAIGITAY